MKRFLFLLLVAFLSLIPYPSSFVFADEETLTLLPNAKHEYRFDYRGDRTEITVVVEAPEGVELSIYAPDQAEPVGHGTRQGDGLVWAGKSRLPGAYRATVENKTPGPILYSMAFLGEGVSNVARIITDESASTTNVSAKGGRLTLNLDLPTGARRLTSPVAPTGCTPASALPQIVNTSITLCPNEIYPPMHLVGNNIGLFDNSHSAIINAAGRQFAVVIEGTNNWIDGVVIQAAPDAADAGAFLCQYDECIFPTQPNKTDINGGLAYGGGILLLGRNNVVHNTTVRGGTIGVATVDGYNNVLVENNLSDLNGWGSFNIRSANSVFVSNRFDRDNHGCTTPDGHKFEHGCETAGWVCLRCANNLIARNHCETSGNCFYMSGERGLASNNNRFTANYCASSPNNCFELTFSKGNILQDNIATAHPTTGVACKYPFWIGGSTVYFGKNTWECTISPQDSINDAVKSTNVPTLALALGNTNLPFVTNAPPPPTRAPKVAPTAPSAPAPSSICRQPYSGAIWFNWNTLTEWLRCVMTPRSG